MSNITETTLKNNRPAFYGNCPVCKTKMFRIGSLADAKKKADDTAAKQGYGKMNEEKKKAFVRRMKKGKKDAAKGKSKSKGGGNKKGKTKFLDKFGNWHEKWDTDKKRLQKIYSNWLKNKGTYHDGSKRNFIHLAELEGFSPYTAKKFWNAKH